MPDPYRAITNLVYSYADCIDRGDFEGVADVLAHARVTSEGSEVAWEGRQAVLDLYVTGTRRYPDNGTPHTKHVTTNLVIEVDEAAGEGTCRSYFTVLQSVPGSLPLQPIIAGRYHDRFEVVEGVWRFAQRHMIVDLVGDLSQHLLMDFDLPSS